MSLIRQKLLDEQAGIKASEDARKLRDAKKFGKKVQVERLKEREKDKKEVGKRLEGLKKSELLFLGGTGPSSFFLFEGVGSVVRWTNLFLLPVGFFSGNLEGRSRVDALHPFLAPYLPLSNHQPTNALSPSSLSRAQVCRRRLRHHRRLRHRPRRRHFRPFQEARQAQRIGARRPGRSRGNESGYLPPWARRQVWEPDEQ